MAKPFQAALSVSLAQLEASILEWYEHDLAGARSSSGAADGGVGGADREEPGERPGTSEAEDESFVPDEVGVPPLATPVALRSDCCAGLREDLGPVSVLEPLPVVCGDREGGAAAGPLAAEGTEEAAEPTADVDAGAPEDGAASIAAASMQPLMAGDEVHDDKTFRMCAERFAQTGYRKSSAKHHFTLDRLFSNEIMGVGDTFNTLETHNFSTLELQDNDDEPDSPNQQTPQKVHHVKYFAEKNMHVSLNPTSIMQRFMIHPEARIRMLWVGLGLLVIAYDVIVLPLELAYFLPPLELLEYTGVILTGFWVADLVMNFFTGYQTDGITEMRPWPVAETYLRGWFACDLAIIFLDFLTLLTNYLAAGTAMDEASGSTRIVKAGRTFRMLRLLRLVRLMRMKKLIDLSAQFFDSFTSELRLMVAKVLRLVTFILILNHYIACAWYAIAHLTDDDYGSWLDGYDHQDDILHLYISAFHWSLTQFTPATQNLGPNNFFERVFANGVVLVALLTFSTFLGKMTSAMTQLLNLNSAKWQEEATVRKFFFDNRISAALTLRIWGCYRQQAGWRDKRIRMQDVEYFAFMPKRLQMQLRREIYTPHLKRLPILEQAFSLSKLEIPAICNHALSEHVGAPLQEIFVALTMAKEAMCVTAGRLEYECRHFTEPVPVNVGDWVCEAAMWGSWTHRGVLTAHASSRWVALDTSKFRSILREISCRSMARAVGRYARSFAEKCILEDIFDILCSPEDGEWRRELAVDAVRPELRFGRKQSLRSLTQSYRSSEWSSD